jgi:hypothetical protein
MDDDIPLPFDLPAVARKKVSAAFDGGRITSDGAVMLLAQAERRLGIADQLARVISDERDADRVVHLLPDILRARIFAIACGYEDADDLDRLRSDPALEPVPSPIGVTTSILGDLLAQLLRVPAAHDVQRETPAGQMVNSRALLGREDRADQLIPDRGPDSDIPKGPVRLIPVRLINARFIDDGHQTRPCSGGAKREKL